MVKYFKMSYTVKNRQGEVPDFHKFPSVANIVADSEQDAASELKRMWNSWNVEVHSVEGPLEMSREEYENG